MNNVLRDIESMGAYDPLIIRVNPKQFYNVGLIRCCNANLKLDNTLFKEGNIIQHPYSKNYWKIKPVWSAIKYAEIHT